jgi:hypothetical protein
MGDAFDLQARLAEVKQQAESQTGRFQIIGALHPMRVVQCFDGIQLDQKHVVDQQVREILTYQDAFVVHLGAVLLHCPEVGGTDFISQRVLIDLFQKRCPSVLRTVNAQPITRPDNSFSSLLSACSACIVFLHLR